MVSEVIEHKLKIAWKLLAFGSQAAVIDKQL
jgi:hypothetical protein